MPCIVPKHASYIILHYCLLVILSYFHFTDKEEKDSLNNLTMVTMLVSGRAGIWAQIWIYSPLSLAWTILQEWNYFYFSPSTHMEAF